MRIIPSNERSDPHKSWGVNSAHEAWLISRAATYSKKTDSPNVVISHNGLPPIYDDENAFLDRELAGGELSIEDTIVKAAQKGLQNIKRSGALYRNISPQTAGTLNEVINRARDNRPPLSVEYPSAFSLLSEVAQLEQAVSPEDITVRNLLPDKSIA